MILTLGFKDLSRTSYPWSPLDYFRGCTLKIKDI